MEASDLKEGDSKTQSVYAPPLSIESLKEGDLFFENNNNYDSLGYIIFLRDPYHDLYYQYDDGSSSKDIHEFVYNFECGRWKYITNINIEFWKLLNVKY